MCGICGKISLNTKVDEALIRRMCSVLTHRGPDDEGVEVLDSPPQKQWWAARTIFFELAKRVEKYILPRSNSIASVGLWQHRMFIEREDL